MDKGDKELQFIELHTTKKKSKSSGRGAIVALAIFVGFFTGFVIGMLLIHYKSRLEIEIVQNELDRVIEEQSAINVTNVYVPERKIADGKIAMNSYNVSNFSIDNGFMAYFDEDGNKISHLGVDLSYHNENINWSTLKESGCEFVMLRCGYRGYTEGGLVEDEKFEDYFNAAKAAGLNVGVYFFTQSTTVEEAIEEADFVLELLDGRQLEYPIALDTEYVNDSKARTNVAEISDELRSEMCIAFCERIREFGYYPIIYASENWMRRDMNLKMLKDYEFWAAQYRDENDFLYDFTMWQYTEEGEIPGIKGHVDLDISMVDYASFIPSMREAYLSGGKIETITSKGTITITTGRQDDPSDKLETPNDSELDEEQGEGEGIGAADAEVESMGQDEVPTIVIQP